MLASRPDAVWAAASQDWAAFEKAVAADFRADHTVTIAGFTFARAEAALCIFLAMAGQGGAR